MPASFTMNAGGKTPAGMGAPTVDGVYRVVVSANREKDSAKGNPMWGLQLKVVDDKLGQKGKVIFTNLNLPNPDFDAVPFILQALVALGYPEDKLCKDGLGVSFEPQKGHAHFKGREGYVLYTAKKGEGTYANAEWLDPATGLEQWQAQSKDGPAADPDIADADDDFSDDLNIEEEEEPLPPEPAPRRARGHKPPSDDPLDAFDI